MSGPCVNRESLNGDGDGSLSRLQNQELYQETLRTLYRTVIRADAAVGDILGELRRLGLDDNTVVIFSSNHGRLLGDHGLFGNWLMHEDSIRVPLIVYDHRFNPKRASGRRDELVLSIDLAPTMLALAGIEVTESMQGRACCPLSDKRRRSGVRASIISTLTTPSHLDRRVPSRRAFERNGGSTSAIPKLIRRSSNDSIAMPTGWRE